MKKYIQRKCLIQLFLSNIYILLADFHSLLIVASQQECPSFQLIRVFLCAVILCLHVVVCLLVATISLMSVWVSSAHRRPEVKH